MDNWYCIYTKPRCEGIVAGRLCSHPDIEILNPKIKTRKYIRGRMREVVEELFPCYIFSRYDSLKYQHMVTYTRGVRRIVADTSGNPYIVDNDIIEQIQSKVEDGVIHVEQPNFDEGDHIVIKEGPLEGYKGIFQKECEARDRVMILLNTLSYKASVEIEKGLLARV